ncbi:MAG: cbb3-type cytochrome c oxidase subunit I [Tannerella sp.]|jgi:cytochrome c oxidase subunit 1|nr:cbb3-type cytochrome c oxidase subunit I [Tannerella sp.]
MKFIDTFMNGEQGLFKHKTLTPMQKLTLQFVVVGLVYYLIVVIEGMLMRIHLVDPSLIIPGAMTSDAQYFAIMTAHPLVGIFGSSYSIVLGAFLFLVPFLMKKPLWSFKMAQWTLWLIAVGTFIFWIAGFISHYSPLYTLYWPLPADFSQFSDWGGAFFILGIALVMVGTLLYVFNIFKTIAYRPKGHDDQPRGVLRSALGFKKIRNADNSYYVPTPVAAIARGTVDTLLNAGIITFTGVLILIYMIGNIVGHSLEKTAVDALLYKNWFWWGLDLIADGLVLIFVAGTWYLLATLISGKKIFMEKWARMALLVEMIVSWFVWSHHLMSDQAQPAFLKIFSGEMLTAFELITQGLAFFVTLATLWSARPLKMTNPLKFLLGGLAGFALAVPAGIMQADLGLNRILHNTQWIVGPHVHVAVLVGLTMTLYAAIYFLLPILTNGAKLYSQKLANFHFWAHLLGGVGMGAFMGMAGLKGMLRRVVYHNGEFNLYMILAALAGTLLLLAFLAFFYNIVMTVGLKGVLGIFAPSKLDKDKLLPDAEA